MIGWLKRLTNREPIAQSSIRVFDGFGTKGSTPHPFDMHAAIRRYASWAYSAANINAHGVAAVPLRLYARKPEASISVFPTRRVSASTRAYLQGRKAWGPSPAVCRKAMEFGDDFEEVTGGHPLLEVFRVVNHTMNGYDLAFIRMIYLALTGNWFVAKVHAGGSPWPTELWPLPSQDVEVKFDRDGSDVVDGFVYGRDASTKRVFRTDEVMWGRMLDPRDPFGYGRGPFQAAWEAVLLDESKARSDRAFFDNYQRPDWIAVFKQGGTKEALDRFEENIQRRFRGVGNKGKFAAITGDVAFQSLNLPPDELGTPDRVIDKIASVFGVPRAKLMGNQNVAGGASESADAGWLRDTILPLLRMDEQKLNESLIPPDLQGELVLAYDDPVPSNQQQDLATAQAGVSGGWMTPNEARQLHGLDPLEEELADSLLINGQPLGTQPQPFGVTLNNPAPQLPDLSGIADAVGRAVKPREIVVTREAGCTCGKSHKASGEPNVGDWPEETKDARRKVESQPEDTGDADDTRRDGEPSTPAVALRRAINRVFDRQLEAVLTTLGLKGGAARGKIAEGQIEAALEEVDYNVSQTAADIEQAVRRIFEAGAKAGLDRLEVSTAFDVTNPEVAEFLNGYIDDLARDLNLTTAKRVQSILQSGLAEGLGPQAIGGRIAEAFADMSRSRSVQIARTESARAYVEGQHKAWGNAGVRRVKWLLAPDACEFCRSVAAQVNSKGGVPLGSPFVTGGSTVRGADGGTMSVGRNVTGPPLHPNDRCDTIPIREDD